MAQLIVSEFVTLDGVMEAPGGEPTHPHTGWVEAYFGDDIGNYKLQETRDAEILLLGRVTYESFAGAWPDRDGEFADKTNAMPKVVVSTTLKEPAWNNTTVLEGELVAGVTRLKEHSNGPILVAGSATLVHALLEHDLVDELRLMIFPVSIGDGLRVFPNAQKKIVWALTDSQMFSTGARVEVYHPA